MGRWRRKDRRRRYNKNRNTENPDHNNCKNYWNWPERQQLRDYLESYQSRAINFHLTGKLMSRTESDNCHVSIGGIDFPEITDTVLAAPYLALPPTLSPKQRKAVYETCTDLGIYHFSVGQHRDTRYTIISIYADGFDKVNDLKRSIPFPVQNFKPFCLTCPDMSERDKVKMSLIDHLIDQPGECIRDNIDELDYEFWDKENLSTMDPPGLEEDDTWMLVDTPEKLDACIYELNHAKPTEIGFDLEAYNHSKYAQLTCLIQISSNKSRDLVIDTLAPGVWDRVPKLAPFFEDPNIVKIGHSIGGLDTKCLHRDFGIHVVNAFDTYEAAKYLKLESVGLASVCKHYGLNDSEYYAKLKEQYQICDWRSRPLTPHMLQYARHDVHFLIKLRNLMIRDLTRAALYDITPSEERQESALAVESLTEMLEHIEQQEEEVGEADRSAFYDTIEEMSLDDNNEKFYTPRTARSLNNSLLSPVKLEQQVNNERIMHASAMVLRLQPSLMSVVGKSQERCRTLWSNHTERHLADAGFMADSQLYEELVTWRDDIGRRLKILPSLVLDLDVLVMVALKKPAAEEDLRRISYQLTDILEECSGFRQELFDIVKNYLTPEELMRKKGEILYYYQNHNIDEPTYVKDAREEEKMNNAEPLEPPKKEEEDVVNETTTSVIPNVNETVKLTATELNESVENALENGIQGHQDVKVEKIKSSNKDGGDFHSSHNEPERVELEKSHIHVNHNGENQGSADILTNTATEDTVVQNQAMDTIETNNIAIEVENSIGDAQDIEIGVVMHAGATEQSFAISWDAVNMNGCVESSKELSTLTEDETSPYSDASISNDTSTMNDTDTSTRLGKREVAEDDIQIDRQDCDEGDDANGQLAWKIAGTVAVVAVLALGLLARRVRRK